jgi:hypothetical protein
VAGCSGEEPQPIDLTETVTTLDPGSVEPGDPNATERQRMQELAEQQCRDDPDLERGVVRLVDPRTDETLAEVVADCAEINDR